MSLVKLKHWRQAATIIMAAKTSTTEASHGKSKINVLSKAYTDYKLLMLKRSSKSKFMPNAYVFPGGVIVENDVSSQWLDLFKTAGCGDVNVHFKYVGPRPSMVMCQHNSPVKNDVAFRICAIREMFEESGILLALDFQAAQNKFNKIGSESYLTRNEESTNGRLEEIKALSSAKINSNLLVEWRGRVNRDENQFLRMCKELEIVPNIWALHEWSDWLTPTEMLGADNSGRRFDTLFYIACLEEIPSFTQDNQEVVSAEWARPLDVIQRYYNKELWIAPPQLYELSRLCHFPFLKELFSFSSHRERHGCQRWLPIRLHCSDGVLSLLPGDELYPKNPDYEGNLEHLPPLQMTMSESSAQGKCLNRLEIKDRFNINIRVTAGLQAEGHALPVGPEFVKDQTPDSVITNKL